MNPTCIILFSEHRSSADDQQFVSVELSYWPSNIGSPHYLYTHRVWVDGDTVAIIDVFRCYPILHTSPDLIRMAISDFDQSCQNHPSPEINRKGGVA